MSGYFMIDDITTYFWALYAATLLYHLLLLDKPFVISRPLQITLTYTLLYLCSLRTFASLHFTGFMGSDSPNYVGLTQYWISHDKVDLTKVGYGDNPGLFILSKMIISVINIDTNLYTILIGITWITIVYLIFRLITKSYTVSYEVNQAMNHNYKQLLYTIAPSIATLSYFNLAVPFMVNFQYSPQTFALVLLLIFFLILISFLRRLEDLRSFTLISLIYATLLISHSFMFLFCLSTITLLNLIKLTNKLNSPLPTLYEKSSNLRILLLTMIVLSLTYIFYQTTLLQRRLGEIVKNILEAFKLEIPIWHFERLATPASPTESNYYIVSVAHSITWIIIVLFLAFPTVKTLISKDSKYYELSIIFSSLIISLLFMNPTLQEFTIRAGQVLLFGIILLAIRGMVNVNYWHRTCILNHIMRILMIVLVISSLLATIRYTWYTQPPHLSPHDMIIVNTLNNKIDNNCVFKILSKNALSVFYYSRNYGNLIFYSSPIFLAFEKHFAIEEYDLILWDRLLPYELFKYTGNELQLDMLLNQGNVVINTNGIIVIRVLIG